MELLIGCSEASIVTGDKARDLGFVGGATIISEKSGKTICEVSGSDEYSFSFDGIRSYKIKRKSRFRSRRIIAYTK